ncbi:hypothetical protein CRU92_04055 [Arcobacter sp. FW59]|nr:hypothetical protein CRU92_04055 [Arcobacter sp. FW59]
MKRGAILLMTLFFIMSISILILKNLSDTNSYVIEQNSKFSKIQMLYYVNNVKNEILKAIQNIENKDQLYQYLDIDFPIILKDSKIIIRLSQYDKYNINLLKKEKEDDYFEFSEYLKSMGIYDIYTLKSIYSDFNNVENNKQLKNIFTRFNKESYNNDIFKAKDYIGFIDYDKKEFNLSQEEKDIRFYELYVTVEYLEQFIRAYYILDKSSKEQEQGVKYFEYSFK